MRLREFAPLKSCCVLGPCDGNTQGRLIQLPVPSRTAWESFSQGLRHRELQKEWPGDFSQGAAVGTTMLSAQAKRSTIHEFSLNKGKDHLNGHCYHPENVSLFARLRHGNATLETHRRFIPFRSAPIPSEP